MAGKEVGGFAFPVVALLGIKTLFILVGGKEIVWLKKLITATCHPLPLQAGKEVILFWIGQTGLTVQRRNLQRQFIRIQRQGRRGNGERGLDSLALQIRADSRHDAIQQIQLF